MKHINKDHNDVKNSTVYTPLAICEFLEKNVFSKIPNLNTVFDPAVGTGNLVKGLKEKGVYVIANDITNDCDFADESFNEDFEHFKHQLENVDLVVMNPPFNGHESKKLYPEIFVDKVFEICGSETPLVAILPTGWRINQKMNSKRWKKVRDTQKISSIITLPLDIFEGVQFHTEIVIFNVDGLDAHMFLDDETIEKNQKDLLVKDLNELLESNPIQVSFTESLGSETIENYQDRISQIINNKIVPILHDDLEEQFQFMKLDNQFNYNVDESQCFNLDVCNLIFAIEVYQLGNEKLTKNCISAIKDKEIKKLCKSVIEISKGEKVFKNGYKLELLAA
ncbi:hypothetical protein [Vibrio furnissii]|uniref:hypothetical protein n=1 Tax=Vibrio furnissii TaxID=29494 RepID=UPI001EEAFFFB|nr:hypothetical protein [Vibrio furnissii]MCG6268589.1 hypothetical protein [Vibrio furnissii]